MKLLLRRLSLTLWLGLLSILVGASAALAFPEPILPWLSYPQGTGSDTEAAEYYAAIGAPSTFSAWKSAYGFTGANDTRAFYYNAADLGFGRDLRCRRQNSDVACYVTNHGYGPGGPPDQSVEAAIAGQNALPFVTLVYKDALNGGVNDVQYFIYDVSGNRLNKAALDTDGDKYAPHLCLPCHGGYYDSVSNSVADGNFLPLDLQSFNYSQRPGYTLTDQQEVFRLLNAMVYDTDPYLQIKQLIDGWYSGNVNQAGATFDGDYVPPLYAGDPGLYANVVKPYCRMCHIAQGVTTLESPSDLDSARPAVFSGFYMPHAEMTSHNFWNSPAPAYLASNRGWALRVTRRDDPAPDGCQPGDCSLREAVIAANAGGEKAIITFDVNGTFSLTLTGYDDDASGGDLDLTGSVIILGNGADKTIISSNGADRVFHIVSGAEAVIRGVTIQNGSVGDHGGGIYNFGGSLVLNDSVVKSNQSTLTDFSGSGIATTSDGVTEINNSAVGPGNNSTPSGWGGGFFVGGATLILNNSTVSGNSAEEGGGLYLSGGAVVTITHSTITLNQGASTGGGLLNSGATVVVRRSIVAGNSGGGSKDCAGGATSQGYNLIGQNGSANGCPKTSTDVILAGAIGTAISPTLQAQGSPVPSHALARNSPALDGIPLGSSCAPPSYDQRNVARPLDGDGNGLPACDIGAYEAAAARRLFLPLIRR